MSCNHDMTADTPFQIPPLSDSFSRLLALPERQKSDLRMLELLVQKDPGATVRLLQLANSAYYRGSSANEARTVPAALPRLGADTVVSVLMALWSIDDLAVPASLVPARQWMTRHIFSLCATSRKVLQAALLLEDVPFLTLQTAALVDRMALATFLSVTEAQSPGRSALLSHVEANNHVFRTSEAARWAADRSGALAQHWGLDSSAEALLAELRHWQQDWAGASMATQVLVLAELLLAEAYAQEEGDLAAALEAAYEHSSLMHRLVERRIDAAQLRVIL